MLLQVIQLKLFNDKKIIDIQLLNILGFTLPKTGYENGEFLLWQVFFRHSLSTRSLRFGYTIMIFHRCRKTLRQWLITTIVNISITTVENRVWGLFNRCLNTQRQRWWLPVVIAPNDTIVVRFYDNEFLPLSFV